MIMAIIISIPHAVMDVTLQGSPQRDEGLAP